jgi:hypothetical protein
MLPATLSIITYSIGTFYRFFIVAALAVWRVWDIVRKKHTALRNYAISRD